MKIAILGGSGNMGRWFVRYLLKEDFQVVITGRNQAKLKSAGNELGVPVATNIDAVKQSDVIIISVTPDAFESVVKEIAPHIGDQQIIIDVSSVKNLPVAIMHRYIKKGIVLGTHPVFGPGAKDVANQNFVLTPANDRETALANQIKEYLTARGAHVSVMSPQDHDEMMTVVLGLAHFIAIVSADTLLSFKRFREMKKVGGTTFKVLYTLIESVISEDPQLYASLQTSFPDMGKVEGLFLNNTMAWADIVQNKDRQGFVDRMSALREKLEKTDPAFRRAYENMYRITESL